MLAPMAGVTDVGMRRIAPARRYAGVFGNGGVGTFLGGDDESRLRAEGEGVSPNAVQLVGHAPTAMAETARRVEAAGAEIIDINMGCPAKPRRRRPGRQRADARSRLRVRIIEAVVRAVRSAGHAQDAPRLGRRRSEMRPNSLAGRRRPASR